ncbi:excinuclease ABC subunit UvrA [Dactylosporangium aurantiacum]|uniref:UvrABC system protein A n=1 Tax=Dactylosporangium aurantiacum TaxID=35754 RepID=A0A9Q9MHW6_9ACTN|nr:excinuclease ABC subunit UvrA [Dactylosporangium aurantiacum]MDG6106544.1 excinuclease ABC subunit UvrA [Dactylosporangium aurantiacum]UWZ50427.1 excinuclease ABC subunit UvrA [Dactylosporangium aurantiacum]
MTPTPARDRITVTGAREHNLKNVTVQVPKHAITVFTGVSGSGKTSLVFDTIAAEAQRQLNDTFTAFARTRLPRPDRPDLDSIDNLCAAVIVDHRRLGGGPRSTVGTATDINPILRLLYARTAHPHLGAPNHYSFNHPNGQCRTCRGTGRTTTVDLNQFLDPTRSLNDGALRHPDLHPGTRHWQQLTAPGYFNPDTPVADYTPEQRHTLLHHTGTRPDGTPYEGAIALFTRLHLHRDPLTTRTRRYVTDQPCTACRGTRLNDTARDSRIDGYAITDLTAMETAELAAVLRLNTDDTAAPIIDTLLRRLHHLTDIGLGHLTLDRDTNTLSGGESQRVKLVRHLNSALVDMLYIFDEPSIGLHPHDVTRLTTLLRQLRDNGNTVLVVEHDRDVIAAADHIIDLGPAAGTHGGTIVYEGGLEALPYARTTTGRHYAQRLPLNTNPRTPTGTLTIHDAHTHNLKHITVDIPTGVLTAVTGVAGSGKTSLIHHDFLTQHPTAVVVDQSPPTASPRATPATHTGIMTAIRAQFAAATHTDPALFSANSTGACPTCRGLGTIHTDHTFMETLKTTCRDCDGRRYHPDALRHRLRGNTIADVLAMTTEEATTFFPDPDIQTVLHTLTDVGLHYLTLGQPLNTLSGGEHQRLKLAAQLHRTGTVYVLDEPTTGLHMADITHLLRIIDRLVTATNTVIVIEHHLDVIKNADWIIDLGPDAGAAGGTVVFEGTPQQLTHATGSHTADALRRDLAQ